MSDHRQINFVRLNQSNDPDELARLLRGLGPERSLSVAWIAVIGAALLTVVALMLEY